MAAQQTMKGRRKGAVHAQREWTAAGMSRGCKLTMEGRLDGKWQHTEHEGQDGRASTEKTQGQGGYSGRGKGSMLTTMCRREGLWQSVVERSRDMHTENGW